MKVYLGGNAQEGQDAEASKTIYVATHHFASIHAILKHRVYQGNKAPYRSDAPVGRAAIATAAEICKN